MEAEEVDTAMAADMVMVVADTKQVKSSKSKIEK